MTNKEKRRFKLQPWMLPMAAVYLFPLITLALTVSSGRELNPRLQGQLIGLVIAPPFMFLVFWVACSPARWSRRRAFRKYPGALVFLTAYISVGDKEAFKLLRGRVGRRGKIQGMMTVSVSAEAVVYWQGYEFACAPYEALHVNAKHIREVVIGERPLINDGRVRRFIVCKIEKEGIQTEICFSPHVYGVPQYSRKRLRESVDDMRALLQTPIQDD